MIEPLVNVNGVEWEGMKFRDVDFEKWNPSCLRPIIVRVSRENQLDYIIERISRIKSTNCHLNDIFDVMKNIILRVSNFTLGYKKY